jgi:hypothetical protein
MGEDGAIVVRKDDHLSRYSAALHGGDTTRVREYVSVQVDRSMPDQSTLNIKPIENVDRIEEGEVIYHVPTLRAYLERHQAREASAGPDEPALMPDYPQLGRRRDPWKLSPSPSRLQLRDAPNPEHN